MTRARRPRRPAQAAPPARPGGEFQSALARAACGPSRILARSGFLLSLAARRQVLSEYSLCIHQQAGSKRKQAEGNRISSWQTCQHPQLRARVGRRSRLPPVAAASEARAAAVKQSTSSSMQTMLVTLYLPILAIVRSSALKYMRRINNTNRLTSSVNEIAVALEFLRLQ